MCRLDLEEDECDCAGPLDEELIIEAATEDIIITEYSADCFPEPCYKKFPFLAGDEDSPFWQGWSNLRFKTFQLIENKYFETAVITMILLSSLALALEDVHLQHRPILQDILYYMDRIFTVIFFFEMLIKWLALGFQKYFTNAWCWLDFIIVMVSANPVTTNRLDLHLLYLGITNQFYCIVVWRRWNSSLQNNENVKSTETITCHVQNAGYESCCKCSSPSHTIYLQRITRLLDILVNLCHHGCAIIRRQIF